MKGLAIALALLLAGCGHVSLVSLPKAPPAAPAPPPAPAKPICPASATADLEPEPPLPEGAGFPAPTTEAESAAVVLYSQWLRAEVVHGRLAWARLGDVKAWCDTPR